MWKRWQLFHATDFQSLMYPCLICCRILGIFPYKINASTFETSRLCYIWLIFSLCIFCIYELIIIHRIINNTLDYGIMFYTLEAISYHVIGGFITIITCVLSGPRMRVLQAMLGISLRLSPELYQKLSRWIHAKDILGTLFSIIQQCIFFSKTPMPNSKRFECCVLTTYISLVIFHMSMQYANCVCVLKACFKRINDNLVHLQNVMVNDQSQAPRLICDTQKYQFLLIELKTLRKQHLTASDTMHTLNVIFSLQLLATTALTFTDLTFEFYFHVMQWQNGKISIIVDRNISNMFFLVSILFEFFKFILIIWACETSKNQALKISTTVHDAFNCTSDEQIKKELQLFSLQILHCSRNTFSTKGLSVNATLLTAMTSSITTYVLILAQFLIMSHSCDKMSANKILSEQYLNHTI